MLGRAAMIAVLLAPTASIARHDDHSTDADPVRWFNVASAQHRADERAHGRVPRRPADRQVPHVDHIRPYLQGHPGRFTTPSIPGAAEARHRWSLSRQSWNCLKRNFRVRLESIRKFCDRSL
jgi:hypothetical protein